MPNNKGGGKAAPPGANYPPKGGGRDQRKERERDLDGGGNGNYPPGGTSKGAKAEAGTSSGDSKESSQKDRVVGKPARSLLNLWRKEGRCLACGSEAHRIVECALAGPKPSTTTTESEWTPVTSSKGSSSKTSGKGPSSSSAKAKPTQPKGSYGTNGTYGTYGTKTVKTKPNGKGHKGQPSNTTPKGSGKGSGSKEQRGVKRDHDESHTGYTPESKKANKKHSYAKAAEGSLELVIRTEAGNHITKREHFRLKTLAEEIFLAQLEKGETLIEVDEWTHTNLLATVHVGNAASAMALISEAKKIGLKLVGKQEYDANRKDFKILTGLVTGPAAQRDRKDLDRFIKAEMLRRKMPGQIEYYSSHKTGNNNLLLSIKVDEDAEPGLEELDYSLRIGASGLVKFADNRSDKRVDQKTRARRLEELQEEIQQAREVLRQKEERAKELNNLEVQSVGSLGVSTLELAEVTKEADATEAMEEGEATNSKPEETVVNEPLD